MKTKSSPKPIQLTVVGAMGRMGQRIIGLAQADDRFQVMAGVEKPGSEFIGRLVGETRAPIVGDIGEVLAKTDVVIDFTAPEAVLKTAAIVARARRALVIGTTGLKEKDVQRLKFLAHYIPIVLSPNMSVGVNLMFELARLAASRLADADIEIIEAHHNLKKDSPSGTALKLAEIVAEASSRNRKDFVFGREGLVGPRPKNEIGVLSVRAGDIVGEHTVLFSHAGERVELIHRAHSRDALASGALLAALWVAKHRRGFYSMQDVLSEK